MHTLKKKFTFFFIDFKIKELFSNFCLLYNLSPILLKENVYLNHNCLIELKKLYVIPNQLSSISWVFWFGGRNLSPILYSPWLPWIKISLCEIKSSGLLLIILLSFIYLFYLFMFLSFQIFFSLSLRLKLGLFIK